MGNPVVTRIATDLGYHKPSSVSDGIYYDQLKYGAMSEWLRASTLDVDPLMGSTKVGVTREYLTERGAAQLMDISQAIDGIKVDKKTAETLIKWMIDQMLFIGEFCNPVNGNIVCVSNQTISYDLAHARIAGIRQPGEHLLQRGLCHWDANRTDNKVAEEFERDRAEREQKLIAVDMSLKDKLGRTNADCRSELFARGYGRFAGGKVLIKHPINSLPDFLKSFVLSRAFPYNQQPMAWDICPAWLLADF